MPVARAQVTYANILRVELGQLGWVAHLRKQTGDVTLNFKSAWQLRRGHAIIVGSGFKATQIRRKVRDLRGKLVTTCTLEIGVPELMTRFSNGDVLRSLCDWEAYAQWQVRFRDASLIDRTVKIDIPDAVPWLSPRKKGFDLTLCLE
jgi:hypothetical protein